LASATKPGTPFGAVSLVKGAEVRKADATQPSDDEFAEERFVGIGMLATIAEFPAPQPDLMVVRCAAGERFRINTQRQLKHGLWVVDVTSMQVDTSTAIPADLQPVAHRPWARSSKTCSVAGANAFAPALPTGRLRLELMEEFLRKSSIGI
jgi:hypothetical protein